jgi:hypothetical protein
MNLIKHIEAVFVVTLGLACSASYLLEKSAQADAQWPATNIATPEKMAIVTVSAKRMSAAEKQQSLLEERKLAALRTGAESRI